jgi:hypothetical protein
MGGKHIKMDGKITQIELKNDIKIPSGFQIISFIPGIINNLGKSAGIEQNWGYIAKDKTNNTECILMYCNPDTFTIIDKSSLEKIRKVNEKQVSWFLMQVGYIGCHTIIDGKSTCIYLHQLLMNYWGHGKGNDSIDHINRNKLDNRLDNLRITTQSEQNKNTGKRSRKSNARELPEGIEQKDIPKYVVYYKEKIKDTYRDFFTVERHPIQIMKDNKIINKATGQLSSSRWATTKSGKITIQDKLAQAIKYVSELDKLYSDNNYNMVIPNKAVEQTVITSSLESEKVSSTETPINTLITLAPTIQSKDTPKQWKTADIYSFITSGKEDVYKVYCEENNAVDSAWTDKWNTFISAVKSSAKDGALTVITEFLEDLRRIRHNALCYKKNAVLIDAADREQWPAGTVLRAYRDSKIDKFKEYLQAQADDTTTTQWLTRWDSFIASLDACDDATAKSKISKFMTSERTRRYRASKKDI